MFCSHLFPEMDNPSLVRISGGNGSGRGAIVVDAELNSLVASNTLTEDFIEEED
jgi:hypothetical protein